MPPRSLERLKKIQEKHPSIGEVRGIGLMIGVEFVTDRTTKMPATELRNRVEHLAFERGLLTLGCGRSVIRISPALCITETEAEEGLKIFEEAIDAAEKEVLDTADSSVLIEKG